MRNDEEFIEAERRARRELVRFFSNAANAERERWAVHEFLANLPIPATEDELMSLDQDNPVDAVFCDANFQVKEVPDLDCRRTFEIREDLKRAEAATRHEDLFDAPKAYDIVWVDAYPLIRDQATSNQYLARYKICSSQVAQDVTLVAVDSQWTVAMLKVTGIDE